MTKDRPNTKYYEDLSALIKAEEDGTDQMATHVRISKELATGLKTMNADDWFAAFNGLADFADCVSLANEFDQKGFAFANGLSIWPAGPKLEVAENASAPAVVITNGIKRNSK